MKRQFLINILFIGFLFFNAQGQTTVTFHLDGLVDSDQKVGIRGNLPPLDWSTSIPLKKVGESFVIDLEFPETKKELEFKFVLFTDDENPTWEGTANRTLNLLGGGQAQISKNKWDREQMIDIRTLEKMTSEGLLADFELIKTMVLDVHPGTFRYNEEAEILTALAELKEKFSSATSYQKAYLAISKLMAQIKCDHTKAGFNNQNKTINSIIHYQKDKVPFTFKWLDEEIVVILNASEQNKLVRGTKIASINKVPVAEIKRRMFDYIGSDGATDLNRQFKLQVDGYDFRYNGFDIFYPLLYPLKEDKIELSIQAPNTNTWEPLVVTTLTREERFERLTKKYLDFPKSKDDMWDFQVLSEGVALLKINSFGLNGWKALTLDYKTFLKDAFQQIEDLGIEHLVIDIRENTGGNDEIANELFSYLVKKNYAFEREGRTRYLTFPEELKPYVQTWGDSPWFYELNPKDKIPKNGYFRFENNFDQRKEKSNKKLYQGKSYLLTSPANTSLAFYTAYRFKLQEVGMIIGQETGGNLNDINGGQILFLRLPNSKIEIDFPIMGGFSLKEKPNRGVLPDVLVNYSLQDLTENKDLELEEVFKIIQK